MRPTLEWLFGTAEELPRAAYLSGRSDLIALQVTSSTLLALGFFALAFSIVWFARCRTDLPVKQLLLARVFGAFAFLSGAVLLVEIMTFWYPFYGLDGLLTTATALMSGATVAILLPQMSEFLRPPPAGASFENNQRLRREVAAHESTLRELEAAQRELESRVAERTKELSEVKARFETALRGARVSILSQDPELNSTWSYSPRPDGLLPSNDSEAVVSLKRRVLERGIPENAEAVYTMPEGSVLFALHVEPTFASDGRVEGITSAAINVSRLRSLETEQQRLSAELDTALQRLETALRGSHITVFTQDRALRYTSINKPMFGFAVHDIIGRTDDEIIPEPSRAPIVALKRAALEKGVAQDGEIRIGPDADVHWFDLHIEPLRDVAGEIVGITCAAVDVTERKEGEAHLRLLMRELTHRSKNLLAVIQAMARQSARNAGTIDAFLERFSARIQALARSHDLLVKEGWHGASMDELVRAQLAQLSDRSPSQISIDGPVTLLRPEVAQSLGLALHELATNAAKYGALSVPDGRLVVTWERQRPEEGSGVELTWVETGGPSVAAPEQRGFGSLVIERNLARAGEADVELSFSPGGVTCRIVIPLTQLYSSM